MPNIKAFLILCLLALSTHCLGETAAPRNYVSAEDKAIPIVDYWRDMTGEENLEELLSHTDLNWETIAANHANFGYTKDSFWFRFTLANATDKPKRRLLVVRAPHLDDVLFVELINDEVVRRSQTGEYYPFSQRETLHPLYIYPVELEPGEAHEFMFRIQSEGSLSLPLEIWREDAFYLRNDREALTHGLYYGFLLFVVTFNLFIFLALREPMYLFYVIFTLMILLVQATLQGRTFQFLWPNVPQLQNFTILVSVPLIALSAAEFSRRFLKLPVKAPRLNYLLIGVSIAGAASIVGVFAAPPHLSKGVSTALVLVTDLILVIIGPYLWWKGVRSARLFTCAWLMLELGASLTLLLVLGVVPHNLLTAYGFEIGSAAEAVLLSVAIVERIYVERNERLKAQEQIIEEQQELQLLEQRRLYEATHSHVTELPSRAYLERFITDRISARPGADFMACLISLQRYRDIDRTLGNENARQLMYQIAHQLNEFVETLDGVIPIEQSVQGPLYVASLDEITLAMLLERRRDSEADQEVRALSKFLGQRIQFGYLSLDLDPRFGLAAYPHHTDSAEGLLRLARIALDATHHSKGCAAVYQSQYNPYSERRLTLLAELDKAIDANKLSLHFQPQLDIEADVITGFEALIRWTHDDFGQVFPDEFIPLAEQAGHITKLTLWVIKQALGHLQELSEAGYANISIAVNISMVDLENDSFIEKVQRLLASASVPPTRLTLELTETALMRDPEGALSALQALRAAGVLIALDDFGVGYSSLSYIKKLPLHKVKIDRSLVSDLASAPDAGVVARTAIDMSHGLGYEAIAEGVEDVESLNLLRSMSCRYIQGYWLARPMPWEFAIEWLRTYAAHAQERAAERDMRAKSG
ncbi:EAL domain-containing protein [Hahella sp. KA22]|uniref:EAL domain-containing protein n=1 Tax=Hahella sp. KA22 TaxID=1628392 RepID=UPI000FDE2AEE|nr:EAL domain-containing protein [Hahella sp. KA22]AZZ90243.1 EAL domain-containing protein [Hahella sp. KA22]QAY53613.1 EAL domain-containing protein [Hahella sp. KA22]